MSRSSQLISSGNRARLVALVLFMCARQAQLAHRRILSSRASTSSSFIHLRAAGCTEPYVLRHDVPRPVLLQLPRLPRAGPGLGPLLQPTVLGHRTARAVYQERVSPVHCMPLRDQSPSLLFSPIDRILFSALACGSSLLGP